MSTSSFARGLKGKHLLAFHIIAAFFRRSALKGDSVRPNGTYVSDRADDGSRQVCALGSVTEDSSNVRVIASKIVGGIGHRQARTIEAGFESWTAKGGEVTQAEQRSTWYEIGRRLAKYARTLKVVPKSA